MLAFVTLEGLDGLHVDDLQLRAGPCAGVDVHEQAMSAAEPEDFSFAHLRLIQSEVHKKAGAEILVLSSSFKWTLTSAKRFGGSDGDSGSSFWVFLRRDSSMPHNAALLVSRTL